MEDVLDDNCSYASMVSDTTDFSYATGCNPALKAAKRTCYGDEGAMLRNNDNRISTTYDNRNDSDTTGKLSGTGCGTLTEFREEVTGSYRDFTNAVYQVSTSWIIRDDELERVAGQIKNATIKPTNYRGAPRVKLLKTGVKVGSKMVNVYI